MKTLLAILLCFASLASHAASVKISALATTNSTLSSTSLFEVSAASGSGGYVTKALTLFDAAAAAGFRSTNFAQANVIDFRRTNGTQNGLSILASDTSLWIQQGPSGATTTTNYSMITNGAWTFDARIISNSAVYLTVTNNFPVRSVWIDRAYMKVNASGDKYPELAVIYTTNPPSAAGSSYLLGGLVGSGLHMGFDGNGFGMQIITGGSLGASVGNIPWIAPYLGAIGDNYTRRIEIIFRPEENAVDVDGDGLRGSITNALFGAHWQTDRNPGYITIEQTASGMTTNVFELIRVTQAGVGNLANTKTRQPRNSWDSFAKRSETNVFQLDQIFMGNTFTTGIVETVGSAATFVKADRSTANLWQDYVQNGIIKWYNNAASADVWQWDYNNIVPFFGPIGVFNNVSSVGSPTNRFQFGYFNTTISTNLITLQSNRLAPAIVTVSGSPFFWTNLVGFNILANVTGGAVQGVAVNGLAWSRAFTNASTFVPLQTNEWLTITNTTVPALFWKPN